MSKDIDLLSPVNLGPYHLPNRMVMAPMTRLRALGSIPQPLMATYYAQRASAGLIVTECTAVSPLSNGYMNCPGIYSDEHIAGWRQVTDAVHQKGGRIFLQLWHCGRLSHPSLLGGQDPVAPSAIASPGDLHTPEGKKPYPTPRTLRTDEIPGIVSEFRQGAENAKKAGFDGVELHGAFGYLIDQFLQDISNRRTDEYGGTAENRARFLLELVDAVTEVFGAERVGVKLSPSNTINGMGDSDAKATFGYVATSLDRYQLAYLHVMEPLRFGPPPAGGYALDPVAPFFRSLYRGTIIANGGFNQEKGNTILAQGHADLVSFGSLFLANPDLPERFAKSAALNAPNMATFYGRGPDDMEKGYTDYPFLS